MREIDETTTAAEDVVPSGFDLGRWVGRHDAFGAIAGRCSAADAECLRLIREQKLYLDRADSWEEFCRKHLHCSRKKADRQIRLLQDHGPAYFQLAALMHINERDFRAIAPHLGSDGLRADGEAIALIPENRDRVADAVSQLKREAPEPEEDADVKFDNLLRKCSAVVIAMKDTGLLFDQRQKVDLTLALSDIQKEARAIGIAKLPQV